MLGKLLSAGGTAHVYQLLRTGDPAVMKLARYAEHEVRARFSLEAEVLRSVGPPGTPALYEQGSFEERPYLVMEFVPGETLAGWMSRNTAGGGLGEIIAYLTRIAAALQVVHDAGYVHRDLKPENIVIGSKGIRLLDFGLVKPIRPGVVGVTQVGQVVGTPHYLAPEQIKAGGTLDYRADIYSLGVIAYEMITGYPPFVGERRAIEYQHQVGRPPPLRTHRSVSHELEELVLSCLAKQPEARPATAAILRQAFSAALSSVGTLRGHGADPKRDSRPLGTSTSVALAWIEHADVMSVGRAIADVHGIVVRHRGAAVLVAFPATQADAPVAAALDACRSIVGEQRRCIVHLTTALERRSAEGKVTLYGLDLDQPETWIAAAPYTGIAMTSAAAQSVPGGVEPIHDLPGFFREKERDRTDATDTRRDPPLVGRDGLVRSVVAALGVRGGPLVNIFGSAGSGKSRVVRAVADQLAAAGAEVVKVPGRRRFLGDRSDDERLAVALGGGDNLLDAATRAAARGIVLAVDDLPCFSAAAQRVLLDRRLPLARVVTSTAPLIDVPDPRSSRVLIELPPVSYADADTLIRALLQPARLIPATLIERLVVRGTGNPALLVNLARDIQRRGAIRRQPGGRDWYVAVDELDTLLAPPGPSWFASRLVDDLPVELSAVVRMSAALGPQFSTAEVGAATATTADADADAEARVAQLVREGVFVEHSNGRFAFQDHALQEALYDLLAEERWTIHTRLVRYWLEGPDRDTIGRLARLAYHAEGAGVHPVAGACWTALARHAALASDHEQLAALFTHALASLSAQVPASLRGALSPGES